MQPCAPSLSPLPAPPHLTCLFFPLHGRPSLSASPLTRSRRLRHCSPSTSVADHPASATVASPTLPLYSISLAEPHHGDSPASTSSSSSSPPSTTRHHSPLRLHRRQPRLSHRRLSPALSLSFSFVRSTVRLPPLHISLSISASISSAEYRWPPPSPSSLLYPHLSHHDCHHPCFPSSFPWCRHHLSAPSIAGFSPSSPPLPPFSTTALPLLPASVAVSRRCRHRHKPLSPPSPSSLPTMVNPPRPM